MGDIVLILILLFINTHHFEGMTQTHYRFNFNIVIYKLDYINAMKEDNEGFNFNIII